MNRRINIRAATRNALQARKERGDVYSRVPFGYRAQAGKLVPVDEEQLVVAEIKSMKAEGMTLMAIADDLNQRGIVGKRGGRYYARTIKNILENNIHA